MRSFASTGQHRSVSIFVFLQFFAQHPYSPPPPIITSSTKRRLGANVFFSGLAARNLTTLSSRSARINAGLLRKEGGANWQTPFSATKVYPSNVIKYDLPISFGHQRAMSSSAYPPAPGWDPKTTPYPSVRRSEKTFVYKSQEKGDVQVYDPYFWLEQTPSESKETKDFCEAQAAFTKQYVEKCKDLKEVRQMLDTVVNYPRYSIPRSEGTKDNPRYYYALNNGLDPQSTWYTASQDELLAAEKDGYAKPAGKKFFDENLMSKEGTVTVGNFYFSPLGNVAAYTISRSGSDWYSVYFRDTSKTYVERHENDDIAAEGGPDRLPDVLQNVKFSGIQWTKDGQGVFYQRYTSSSTHEKGTETDVAKDAELFYHRLGTSQEEDICVVAKDPSVASNIWSAYTTEDGKWLLVTSYKGTEQKNRVYLASLDQPISSKMKWVSVAPGFDYSLQYLANEGNDFYYKTNKDAPNWKIVRASADPSKAKECKHISELDEQSALEDVVKENKEATLDHVVVANQNKLLTCYIKDVKHQIFQFELRTGDLIERLLPEMIGTVSSISAREEDNEAFVSITSFTTPGIVYRFTWDDDGKDPRALPKIIEHRSTKVKGMDVNAFETKQVFVTSDDGEKVPVYLTYRKDAPMNGSAPAYVYFYGGFNHSLMPMFSPRLLSWIGSYGGVLVWVNARGGSEYGERWHNGGNFKNKHNTFNDVISACRYIVDEKIAARGKIIVNGGSNGGMGALAVANLAPEGLLGAILSDVPVADLLRFHHFTAGTFWRHEYGDPDDPTMFDYLFGYSPLHNVDTSKTYPLVLITTADHDDRVSPLHSFKMISELQHKLPNNPNPLLIRVTTDAGHGASNSLLKTLEESTIKYCLAAHVLGLQRQPLPGSLPSSKQ